MSLQPSSLYSPAGSDSEELEAILDTMADGLFVMDRTGIIRRWNRAMAELTGYSAAEAIGQRCSLLSPHQQPRETPPAGVLDCDVFGKGMVNGLERLIRRKDGATVPVIANGRALRDEQGEPLAAVFTLTDASSLRRLEDEVAQLRGAIQQRYEFHNIVGHSAQMREVFSLIELAAASLATVLVTGETGTGKELVAKAIHYHSDRRDGPMVSVNCSALSASLLESELFGHVKGAFTGAVKDHAGRFERADGGTLFLDEVGEIPPVVQVKLLRALQEREIERVGGAVPRSINVRVIAATHRDLRRMVRQGDFREDLYYRLKVFAIPLPPLRERKEDIPPLVERFIERFNEQTGKAITGLAPEAMRIVMDHCWPGNVRELENAIEHAFVTCPGPEITPLDLPVELREHHLRNESCPPQDEDSASDPAVRRPGRRQRTSREELLHLLEECGWNKAEVARRLGITRTSVWRRMRKLGLPLQPTD